MSAFLAVDCQVSAGRPRCRVLLMRTRRDVWAVFDRREGGRDTAPEVLELAVRKAGSPGLDEDVADGSGFDRSGEHGPSGPVSDEWQSRAFWLAPPTRLTTRTGCPLSRSASSRVWA